MSVLSTDELDVLPRRQPMARRSTRIPRFHHYSLDRSPRCYDSYSFKLGKRWNRRTYAFLRALNDANSQLDCSLSYRGRNQVSSHRTCF